MLVGAATQNLALPYHTTNKANTCLTQMTNVRLLSAQRSDKDKKRETIDRGLKTLPHLAFTSIEMPLPVSVPCVIETPTYPYHSWVDTFGLVFGLRWQPSPLYRVSRGGGSATNNAASFLGYNPTAAGASKAAKGSDTKSNST